MLNDRVDAAAHFIQPSPDESSYETRSRRSRPTIFMPPVIENRSTLRRTAHVEKHAPAAASNDLFGGHCEL